MMIIHIKEELEKDLDEAQKKNMEQFLFEDFITSCNKVMTFLAYDVDYLKGLRGTLKVSSLARSMDYIN